MTASRIRAALVTNFCQYYRVPLFESLARDVDVEYFFYSKGDEKYWLPEQGVSGGRFRATEVPGFRVLGTSVNPSLITRLWRGRFDVYLSGVVGRFAMPATYLVARLRGKPFVLWTQIWMRLKTPAHRVLFPATRFVYRHADAVVASGAHVRRYLISEGVDPGRVFDCGEGLDNRDYSREVTAGEIAALRDSLRIGRDDKIVLFVGRIEEEKGLPFLVEAFARLRRDDAVLVIAGSGTDREYRDRLEAQVDRLGVRERVRFAGFVPRQRTPEYYACAWVCVVPSITTVAFKEPWGLVVNEAFNQGVPVIATDCVGAAAGGLLRDGEQGFVVAERDAAALARALGRLLDDGDLRRRMGESARAAIAEWGIERMVSGFRAAIDFVCRGDSAGEA